MNDLELFREMMADPRLHVGIGTITQLGLSQDGGILRAAVNLMPENREIVAEVTFADVNSVTFPEVDDLALLIFVDGHPDEAFVVKTINNSDEPIPVFAQTGNTMISPRQGQLVGIGRSTVTPTEPLVLGNVTVSALTALANAFLNAAQIGQCALGPVALDPSVRVALTNFVETYLDEASSNILSQVAFTERGAD